MRLPDAKLSSTVAMVGIVLLALGLRGWSATDSLWVDELHTAWCALGGALEVSPRAALGNQSPVFFWLEWLLVRLLGPSEIVLRLPSLLAGSALPVAVFLFARRWLSAGSGLVAAAILAVDPLAIFYSTEARPYALVQLLVVLHVGLAVCLIEQPTRHRRAWWIGLGALLFHLHYTTVLVLASEAVYLAAAALWLREKTAHRLRHVLVDTLLIVCLCLPAAGNVAEIFGRRNNWTFVERDGLWAVFQWWPPALGLFYLVASFVAGRRSGDRRTNAAAAALVCWFCLPALVAWMTTELNIARLLFPRYLIAIQPAAALLGARCIDLAPWRATRWLAGALLVCAAVFSGGIVERVATTGRLIAPRENWRDAVAWLNQQRETDPLPVIVHSGLIELNELSRTHDPALAEYCLYPVNALYPLDAHLDEVAPLTADETGGLTQNVEMLIIHRGGAWLIVRGSERTARQLGQAIVARLKQTSPPDSPFRWRVEPGQSFHGVQVVLVRTE